MTWREIYTTCLQDLHDAAHALTISEPLVLSFCELLLCLFLLRTRNVLEQVQIPFLSASIVPGMAYLPIVNIHTLRDDVSVIREARDANGQRLGRIGFVPVEIFDDRLSLQAAITDFYTIGATLFGVRPAPQSDQNVEIIFIPYIPVNALDDAIPLSDDYRLALEQGLSGLMLARLGHFERAKLLLEETKASLGDVRSRVIRA